MKFRVKNFLGCMSLETWGLSGKLKSFSLNFKRNHSQVCLSVAVRFFSRRETGRIRRCLLTSDWATRNRSLKRWKFNDRDKLDILFNWQRNDRMVAANWASNFEDKLLSTWWPTALVSVRDFFVEFSGVYERGGDVSTFSHNKKVFFCD